MLRPHPKWYTPNMTNPASDNPERCESLLSSRRALFVSAHPDDIEFRAGGLVTVMRKRGIEIIFAIATRGGKGLPGPLRRGLERTRTRYQMRAAEILGGAEVIFYDYPDGHLGSHVEAFAADLQNLVTDRQPDLLLSWDPDYIFTPHPDHQAAADAVKAAGLNLPACYYGTSQPNLWVGFDREVLNAKLTALKAHRTETPWFYFDLRQKRTLIRGMAAEGAKVNSPYAETFRLA